MKNVKHSVHIWIGENNGKYTTDIQGDIHPAELCSLLESVRNRIYEDYEDEIYSYVQEQARQDLQS